MEIIELYDENGNLQKFKLLDTFGMDEDDYVVLIPVDESDDLTYILRIEYANNDELNLVGIEDQNELNAAVDIYEKLKNEKIQ
ncbi:MAG: DUF1292 domain-containing protein [Tissierellia bacterium]|nr:DUF1292 domain-containing protein [Tissierellia bacterium]